MSTNSKLRYKIEKKIRTILRFEIGYDKKMPEPIFFKADREAIEKIILVLARELTNVNKE